MQYDNDDWPKGLMSILLGLMVLTMLVRYMT